jgi:hypothetical protein
VTAAILAAATGILGIAIGRLWDSRSEAARFLAARITALMAVLHRPDGLSDQYVGGPDPDLKGVIAPDDSWKTSIWLFSIEGNNLLRPGPGDSWHVSVAFKVLDSDGRWWERIDNGAPIRILR